METILRLRSAALLVPYKRTGHPLPFACHLSRHLDFVGRIRFPRSVLLPCHHRSVSCSATAPPPPPLPPKNGEENGNKDCVGSGRKAVKVAAISAAVALACALCAVYLRRGPPIPKLLGRTACIAACVSPMDLQAQNTNQGKSVVQETRDVVWEILFKVRHVLYNKSDRCTLDSSFIHVISLVAGCLVFDRKRTNNVNFIGQTLF